MSRQQCGRAMNSYDSRHGLVAGSGGHGNRTSRSIKSVRGGGAADEMSDCQVITSFAGRSSLRELKMLKTERR
jgi:hypothetical protein